MSDEKQVLEKLRQHAEKARRDLSNPAFQPFRERTIVAGLLRVLKIPYEDCEIRKEKKEQSPIDVHFRGARFQVTEIHDEGRKRNDELRERQERLKRAKSLAELWEPVRLGRDSLSPTARAPEYYFQLILSRSQDKVDRYRRVYGDIGDIDLLVSINRPSIHLYPTDPWPDPGPLKQHGWRSVAFVGGGPYARVLYANDDALAFLRKAVGKTHFWEQLTDMFPQALGPQCEPEAEC